VRNAVTRGVALFLAGFTLLNLLGDLRFARANANVWWIDFWPLPLDIAWLFFGTLAIVLAIHALAPSRGARFRRAAQVMTGFAAVAALVNAARFYRVLSQHTIRTAWPVPLSLFVFVALVAIAFDYGNAASRMRSVAVVAVIAAVLFPIAQVGFFGATDYRRPADLIVVFGARAKADGTPSDALADRVATACELYRAGLARRLLFSGGPGEGAFTEPRVMRSFAEKHGVPASAIIEDAAGLNTEATVRNTRAVAGPQACVLVVSHFYHLPRIKMTYQRYGMNVCTVPSRDSVPFSMPYNIAREDVAFWAYYLRRFALTA
jgi:vancomycin permeability regulator SanA